MQLKEDLSGVRVGVVEEGFVDCQSEVAAIVKAAAVLMTKAGATVEDVSIPMHTDGKDTVAK